jgi:sec-independent protein translocase protein TatC
MARVRSIAHDDRLSLVEHLDELRTRIVRMAIALAAAFGLAFWQHSLLVDVANAPLPGDKDPITLSPTEPFMTTMTLAMYAAILLALPVILHQLYAFVLPAFAPAERRVALPLMLMVPLLFVGGVAFGYFVVLKPALSFLLNFNAADFNTQIRARDYYSFVSLSLISMGLLYQVPVGILLLTRLGVTTPAALRRKRRLAYLGCAVLAALLPTIDPVTMLLEMVPLVVLYELSILLAVAFGPRAAPLEAVSDSA